VKIYLASSWKNKELLRSINTQLKSLGHNVDCFCSADGRRTVFNFKQLKYDVKRDNISIRQEEIVKKAFEEDKKWLDWCEALIMFLPCGKSAHLEAGYAKGKGKKVYFVGSFPVGELDVMYGFADGLYRYEQFKDLLDLLYQMSMAKS
jgi:hypothetical protein